MSRPVIHQTIDRLTARCVEEGDCLLWQGGCDGHGRPQCRRGSARIGTARNPFAGLMT